MIVNELYAHHNPGHITGGGNGKGNGNGNGNGVGNGNGNVPEIDGGELPLALLSLFCVWLLLKKLRRS